MRKGLGSIAVWSWAGLACACGTGKTAVTPVDAGKASDVQADSVDAGDVADVGGGPKVLRWTAYPTGSNNKLRGIAGIPGKPGSYVAVGDAASVWRLDDTELTTVPLTEIAGTNLRAIWISSSGTWFVAGEGSTVLHHNAQGWNVRDDVAPAQPVQFAGISGSSDTDVWAVGSSHAVWHFSGEPAAWLADEASPTGVDLAIPATTSFTCVTVPAPGEVWIGASLAQGGAVLHGSGGKWTAFATEQAPTAIWASGSGASASVIVAGGTDTAYVAMLDKGAFVKQKPGWPQGFYSLAGLTPTQVWAGASKGQLRQYDGTAWKVEDIKSPPGTKPADTFAASETLIGLAIHSSDERAVATPTQLYRWAKQSQ
jgi:hypothetical protein